jgi:hypothetical protein
MSVRDHPARASVLALAGGLAILLGLWWARAPGVATDLACLAPGAIAFMLLWRGRYPGEKAIGAFIGTSRPRRTRAVGARKGPGPMRMPRGGALLAAALAGRGPPLLPRLR